MNKSKSYDKFCSTLQRSYKLIELYRRLRKVKFIKEPQKLFHKDLSDLLRAAIVFSVSAMDAYFTNKFSEILVPFIKKKGATEGIIKLLSDAGLDTKQAVAMIGMQRPYRRVRMLIETYFERFTTQKSDIIDQLLLSVGIKNFSKNAQKLTKRTNLVRRIELLVERRHVIVHEGDLNKHGRIKKIEVNKVERQIQEVQLFVENSETLINKKLN